MWCITSLPDVGMLVEPFHAPYVGDSPRPCHVTAGSHAAEVYPSMVPSLAHLVSDLSLIQQHTDDHWTEHRHIETLALIAVVAPSLAQ